MAANGTTPSPGEQPAGGYPTDWEADVLLRDGHPVHLRPITPLDGPALRAFHASLSDRTVYFRFFAVKPELTDQDVAYFTGVDHDQRVALVALDGSDIVGVGRFDAIGDGSAEVAFVIRDAVQGLGLGSILLEHLTAAARERGIERFTAEVLPENSRMLTTFRDAGYDISQRREDDVIVVSFAIEPTSTSRAVMRAREHRAEARSVHRILHPAGVAVVGASRSGAGLGSALLRHMVAAGYPGSVVAVHPMGLDVPGVRSVTSLGQVAAEVDLAVVVVPADRVAEAVHEAAEAGVHGLIVVSGGFGDVGGDGPRLQEELVSLVHRTGMRLVGPNALGVINTDPAVRLNASLVPEPPAAGHVGLFSQSGALGTSILARFDERGLGVSTFVSAGNRADISGNDLLQYWQTDERTRVVALYLETIGNARKFARIVHGISRDKPVVMVRMGGARQRHPLGHAVGRTDLSQQAVDGILRDCGLIVVDGIGRLIDVARVAATEPLARTSSIAIVGNSDALAVLAVNALEGAGLSLAADPVTFPRLSTAQQYASAIDACVVDHAVGGVLVIHVPPIEDATGASLAGLLETLGDAEREVPVVVVAPGGRSDALAVYDDVEDALSAAGAWAAYARWREADARRRADREDWPDATVTDPAIGRHSGAAALDLVPGSALRLRPPDDRRGCRIRLDDDPVFGPVIAIGLDDPVAEALEARVTRLAPVVREGALGMLAELGTLDLLAGPVQSEDLAALVVAVSRLPGLVPGVTAADLRGVSAAPGAGGHLTVWDISVTVSPEPVEPDPTTRRL